MEFLAQNTCLGKLKIAEIYDEFEGPKYFLAKNTFRQQFLCYWIAESENRSLTWLYMQISDAKLRKIINSDLDARTAFKYPEQGLYVVITESKSSNDKAEFIPRDRVSENLLPPSDVYISSADVESCDIESDWVYELSIKRQQLSKQTTTRSVSELFDKFQVVIDSLMHAIAKSIDPKSKRSYSTHPLTASYGSFEVKFGSTSRDITTTALKRLSEILESDDEMSTLAVNHKLSPFDLINLFTSINRLKLKIFIKPRFYKDCGFEECCINGNLTEKIRLLAESENPIIASKLIPQANDLDKVVKILELIYSGKEYSFNDFSGVNEALTSKRQVRYYEDAAYSLGLVTKGYSLTSAGFFLISRTSKTARYQVLADRFESSDFGWAWMRWLGVHSIKDLDPTTAEVFLLNCVPELGVDTSKRRATTLVKWLNELKPYHRKYD